MTNVQHFLIRESVLQLTNIKGQDTCIAAVCHIIKRNPAVILEKTR